MLPLYINYNLITNLIIVITHLYFVLYNTLYVKYIHMLQRSRPLGQYITIIT